MKAINRENKSFQGRFVSTGLTHEEKACSFIREMALDAAKRKQFEAELELGSLLQTA